MIKKRKIDRVSFRSKHAQITIFMILGIIILFTFLFMIKLSSEVKIGELEAEKEKVLTKTFKKEALRIYVEDCLNDALEEGLIKIGQQGRIWSGQPGGTKVFTDKISGINYNSGTENSLVAYALTRETSDYPHAYPCDKKNQANETPSFCRYKYPNTTVGFGDLVLDDDTLKEDLAKYLINRTKWCVHNFTESEISKYAQIEEIKIDLTLDIQNDGINLQVKYPLKMTIGKEEFFQISEFDFFYPSQFRGLLDAAVTRPLQNDWKYLDFAYNETVLKSPNFLYGSKFQIPNYCSIFKDYFLCAGSLYSDKYQSLGIGMERKELADGNDLFIFSSPQILNLPEKYTFQVARQNRPPALDYVHRLECLDSPDPAYRYDYLVIKDDEIYGNINFSLNASDPDEDEISDYEFKPEFNGIEITLPNNFLVRSEKVKELEPKVYPLTVTATDEHGLSDWQEVRVLVDSPLKAGISLWLPYTLYDGTSYKTYSELFFGEGVVISNEDPIFVDLTFPEDSVLGMIPTARLEYTSTEGKDNFNLPISSPQSLLGQKICYSFPFSENMVACSLDNYKNKLDSWPTEITTFDLPYFQDITETGILKIIFSRNYCATDYENPTEVNIRVAQCLPHFNPDYPFPYIPNDQNQNYKWYYAKDNQGNIILDLDGKQTYNRNDSFNPFLATHACCNPNSWTVYPEGYPCFEESPELGCFGGSDEAKPIGGYLLEERSTEYYCDGMRGNICGGEDGENNAEIYISKNLCGDFKLNPNCNQIASVCANQVPFSIIPNSDGTSSWCHGDLGCGKDKKACTTIAVDIDSDDKFASGIDKCGCTKDTVGKKCKNLQIDAPGFGVCKLNNPPGATPSYGCVYNLGPTLTNPDIVP
ncbi:MAG TPA: hypothetical protein VJA23_02770 [Candidatus Nanoarchaeia archaeon]|nr:hypothetical protein [Candidatus Nanoarchaeia archaeon]